MSRIVLKPTHITKAIIENSASKPIQVSVHKLSLLDELWKDRSPNSMTNRKLFFFHLLTLARVQEIIAACISELLDSVEMTVFLTLENCLVRV